MFKFPAPNSNLRVVATSLGINLKTAKALSLNIPDKRLALADEVLQPDPSCRLPMMVSGVQIAAAVRATAATTTTLSVPARPVEHHSKRRRKPLGSASRILVLG